MKKLLLLSLLLMTGCEDRYRYYCQDPAHFSAKRLRAKAEHEGGGKRPRLGGVVAHVGYLHRCFLSNLTGDGILETLTRFDESGDGGVAPFRPTCLSSQQRMFANVQSYKSALQLDPKDLNAMTALGDLLLRMGRESDAMKYMLPLKQKQIEQTRFEAEARKEATIKNAEAAAQAKVMALRSEVILRIEQHIKAQGLHLSLKSTNGVALPPADFTVDWEAASVGRAAAVGEAHAALPGLFRRTSSRARAR